jgi:hypothetical protein
VTPEQQLIAEGVEIIERDGWHQGNLYAGAPPRVLNWEKLDDEAARTAPVCMMGSLYRALLGTCDTGDDTLGDSHPVVRAAEKLSATIVNATADLVMEGTSVVSWYNDKSDTTKEDVLLMMKRAVHED